MRASSTLPRRPPGLSIPRGDRADSCPWRADRDAYPRGNGTSGVDDQNGPRWLGEEHAHDQRLPEWAVLGSNSDLLLARSQQEPVAAGRIRKWSAITGFWRRRSATWRRNRGGCRFHHASKRVPQRRSTASRSAPSLRGGVQRRPVHGLADKLAVAVCATRKISSAASGSAWTMAANEASAAWRSSNASTRFPVLSKIEYVSAQDIRGVYRLM